MQIGMFFSELAQLIIRQKFAYVFNVCMYCMVGTYVIETGGVSRTSHMLVNKFGIFDSPKIELVQC